MFIDIVDLVKNSHLGRIPKNQSQTPTPSVPVYKGLEGSNFVSKYKVMEG
jgi:hypothetical protein